MINVVLESYKARKLNRILADICSDAAARDFAVWGVSALRVLYRNCKSLCCVMRILRDGKPSKKAWHNLLFRRLKCFFFVLNPARHYWHYADTVLEIMQMSFLFRCLSYSSSSAVTMLEGQQHLRHVSKLRIMGSLKDSWQEWSISCSVLKLVMKQRTIIAMLTCRRAVMDMRQQKTAWKRSLEQEYKI